MFFARALATRVLRDSGIRLRDEWTDSHLHRRHTVLFGRDCIRARLGFTSPGVCEFEWRCERNWFAPTILREFALIGKYKEIAEWYRNGPGRICFQSNYVRGSAFVCDGFRGLRRFRIGYFNEKMQMECILITNIDYISSQAYGLRRDATNWRWVGIPWQI